MQAGWRSPREGTLGPPSQVTGGHTCFLSTSALVTLSYHVTITDAVWLLPGPGGLPVSSVLTLIELVQPQPSPGPSAGAAFRTIMSRLLMSRASGFFCTNCVPCALGEGQD